MKDAWHDRTACWLIGHDPSIQSIMRCVALIASKRSHHESLYLDSNSVIFSRGALSSTRKSYTSDCQICCSSDLFSRFSTWRSSCLAARPGTFLTGHSKTDFSLIGVDSVIFSHGAAKLKSVALVRGYRMITVVSLSTIEFRDAYTPKFIVPITVKWITRLIVA